MGNTYRKRSASARALAAVLREGGEPARRIRDRFDRSFLWRLLNGQRAPSLDTALWLEGVDARVTSRGWGAAVRAA